MRLDIGSSVPSALALTPATAGRWLVYSSVDPSNPTLAGLAYDFKQYARHSRRTSPASVTVCSTIGRIRSIAFADGYGE